ncbi:MAG TPA: cysteine hydrolase [Candidatus Scatomorpha merdigallinarum]|nr:cysteine hydrolase [Candidatus Scatomorpha merdigallinarum]
MTEEITASPEVREPNRYLIAVDLQNDFITGALGTQEAQKILTPALEKLRNYPGNIIFTLDTHAGDYLETEEGRLLPVEHCIFGTDGWQLPGEFQELQRERNAAVYLKETFGSVHLAQDLLAANAKSPIEEIELIGLCTDICVISNALLIKAGLPNVPIYVDASCCAGVTPEKHNAALEVMKSCLIHVRD